MDRPNDDNKEMITVEKKKKGVALIVHDLRKKELVPIKILSFLIHASK